MHPQDKANYIQRYEAWLAEYGDSPRSLGWSQHSRQDIRFRILGAGAIADGQASVLDVGCGFADLYTYLRRQGWEGEYTGLDIVPGVLQVARQKHPDLDLRLLDILSEGDQLGSYDYVIASGIFNAKLQSGNEAHIPNMLRAMHARARVATCVDFMSTYVDYQKDGAHHTDPSWALAQGLQLSRRVVLRQDYMPFEFALIVYKDDSRSPRNVFNALEDPAPGSE